MTLSVQKKIYNPELSAQSQNPPQKLAGNGPSSINIALRELRDVIWKEDEVLDGLLADMYASKSLPQGINQKINPDLLPVFTRACYNLGKIHEKGEEGVEPNPALAMNYYAEAIVPFKESAAQCALDYLLNKSNDNLFINNPKTAIYYLEKVAAIDEETSFVLAQFYESGIVENDEVIVPQNPEKAIFYYKEAIRLGHAELETAKARIAALQQAR